MVTIVDYHLSEDSEGKEFFSLSIQGKIEMVKSKETGRFYATARRTRITSTFDEDTCRDLLGTKLPGAIVKVDCEPYEYTIPETGEIVSLNHSYQYVPEETESIEEAVFS